MDMPAASAICRSSQLIDGGRGIRFQLRRANRVMPAFVVRYAGRVRGYLNQCGHLALPLDIKPGRFFDTDRRLLICATHAALYDPLTGHCTSGPCRGNGLVRVPVKEQHGWVLLCDEHQRLVGSGETTDF